MTRVRLATLFAFTALIALSISVATHAGGKGKKKKDKPLPFASIKLFFEFNETDEDLGVQLKLGADPFERLKILDPCGHKILDIKAKGDLREHGLSDLFFESAEPTFDEVPRAEILARFPEGEYTFIGRTIEGKTLKGTADLSHDIPDGPVILSPGEGDEVEDDDLEVSWSEVTTPTGIEIESYQIIVTNEEDSQFAYDIRMPSDARSVTVPGEFLEAGVEYELEILAVAANGNQTISIIFFTVEE